ncbi:hypothetical protein LTR84_005552 [Exophiala bonariae]|uniref:Protection of telomeres protein 1 n=1 Tax=Exophiala bonariae TaxID=1690606 RepID=A0AAV9N4B2_9EURO|nr:hypothetical protein LTR84_005552 [Exophiala bonariae]
MALSIPLSPPTTPELASQEVPIEAMPTHTSIIPRGFTDLHNALTTIGTQQNVIGVCFDFLPPTKSKGTDYMIKFRLHDPSWNGVGGMEFRYFRGSKEQLPRIENQGDVVILRQIKTASFNGSCGLSNRATEWSVLPFSVMQGSLDNIKSAALHSFQGRASSQKFLPTIAELQYAKYISEQEDPNRWPAVVNTANLPTSSLQHADDQSRPRKKKFTEIQAIEKPINGPPVYVELLGEVRKIFSSDLRTELSITDYTSNSLLYDYQYGDDETGRDGDQFNYIKDESKTWPGPWGTRTIVVTLWDAHHQFAISNVTLGSFVYLRNVKIKLDKSGLKVEGVCNGDRFGKVHVELRKPREATGDDPLLSLLRRKREYETKATAENIHFVRDAQNKKRKADTEKQHQQEEETKSKKQKARERRKKNRRSKTEIETAGIPLTLNQERPQHTVNSSIRCLNHDVPCTTIADILDPTSLQRKTPKGNSFSVPFQNCKYKSKVRVIDYFPDNVEDFAVPQRDSEYDVLSDHGSGPESDVDLSQGIAEGVKWVWRFFLLIEDANPQTSNGNVCAQMQLLVADADGEFLLNQEAFDMRDEKNGVELARTKEKLFHLWGDLQEWKEEHEASEALDRTPQARPFECMIKEYGALVPSYLRTSRGQDGEYERSFRMFGVTI